MSRKFITALALTLTALPGCVMQTEESSTQPSEDVGTAEQAVNMSGLVLVFYDNPAYPNVIVEGQKFELLSMILQCQFPQLGCDPNGMPLRQVRVSVTAGNKDINLGQIGWFINGTPVDTSKYLSSVVFSQRNPSLVLDVGQSNWATFPAGEHTMVFLSAKQTLFGMGAYDQTIKVGDVITVTANPQNVQSGGKVVGYISIVTDQDPVGSPTHQTPSGNPPYTDTSRVWFVDLDSGPGVTPRYAPFMVKTPGSAPDWYASVANSSLSMTSTAP